MATFAHEALADALRRDRSAVVEETVRALYARHPEWDARWGVSGRELTARDTAFHLEFLEAAFRSEDDGIFTRYSSWLANVLRSRNVPVEAAAESYDLMDGILAPRLAPSERPLVSALLARGRDALNALPPVPGRRYSTMPPRAEELVAALLAADRKAVQRILEEELVAARGLATVGDAVIQPAMAELGRLWQENKVTVAQEHLATAILQTSLARAIAASAFGDPRGGRALFACVEGNFHGIGLRVVSDAFEHAGWDVRYLGTDVPSREIIGATRDWTPEILGLSLSLPQHVATARRLIDLVRSTLGARAPRVVVGGIPLNDFPGLARVVGADEMYPDASSVLSAYA